MLGKKNDPLLVTVSLSGTPVLDHVHNWLVLRYTGGQWKLAKFAFDFLRHHQSHWCDYVSLSLSTKHVFFFC